MVRILAGVAGRSLTLMVGMAIGAVDALAARRALIGRQPTRTFQPVVVGVAVVLSRPRR